MSDRLTAVRISRRSVAWGAGIFVVLAVVGVLCGLLWRSRLDIPHGVVVSHQWFPDPWDGGERASFAATGWYVVVALGAGVVLGVLAASLSRAQELVTLAAVLVGSVVGTWLMLRVGLHGAPPDPQLAAAHAADGTRLSGTISRPGAAALVTWPLAAVAVVGGIFLLVPGRRTDRSEIEE
ncbi:hypothetical protein GCM10009798_21250 [Nocardioides panacihumi]|uniref:Trp biosynthesis protein n=1 Tax=Nocardioides panacihumi TaxID=400774 RepID=A0ABP5CES5_9ACTN